MKRFLQMTTAAATAAVLALGTVGFADALPEENLLPAVGDVVEGFEVIETRPFGMIGADLTLFEHQATGATLVYEIRLLCPKSKACGQTIMLQPAGDTVCCTTPSTQHSVHNPPAPQ